MYCLNKTKSWSSPGAVLVFCAGNSRLRAPLPTHAAHPLAKVLPQVSLCIALLLFQVDLATRVSNHKPSRSQFQAPRQGGQAQQGSPPRPRSQEACVTKAARATPSYVTCLTWRPRLALALRQSVTRSLWCACAPGPCPVQEGGEGAKEYMYCTMPFSSSKQLRKRVTPPATPAPRTFVDRRPKLLAQHFG